MQEPFVLVIFGATGDLTGNKLIPALFSLFKAEKLPKAFSIIGFARRALTNEAFALSFTALVSDPKWLQFSQHLEYQQAAFEDASAYQALASRLQAYDQYVNTVVTHIFYLATPPEHYDLILDHLYEYKTSLSQIAPQVNGKVARLAIEKPFGKNLVTAQMLDKKLAEYFNEWQVFRVDHYLGKETVQNMLIFRFANNLFEPVWNKEYVDHVQITFAEKKGLTGRGRFYDGVGELRDVGQNHLMQLLAAVAMEMPRSFSKEGVRDARAAALQALECIEPKDVNRFVVRGQYEGYKKEKDVAKDSSTETFVATKFFVNTPRFAGVPFYIRAGKGLQENNVSISLVFKQTCHVLFKEVGCPEEGSVLTFRIQPKEGISLQLIAKKPGTHLDLQTVDMHLSYAEAFTAKNADAYEKILLDILIGDQMLFNRADELESSWKFITNILEGWKQDGQPLDQYPLGSMGPQAANALIEKDARKWIG